MRIRIVIALTALIALILLLFLGLVVVRLASPHQWNSLLATFSAPEAPASPVKSPPTAPVTAVPMPASQAAEVVITPAALSALSPAPSAASSPAIVLEPAPAPAPGAQKSSPALSVYVPPKVLPAQEHWTWNIDGRDYHDVVIRKVDADSVSVLYAGGAGSFEIAQLDPDLRRKFNYNPARAADSLAKKRAAQDNNELVVEQLRVSEVQAKQQQGIIEEQQRQETRAQEAADLAAAVRLDQAKNARPNIEADVNSARRQLHVNPLTGQLEGDEVSLRRYNEGLVTLQACDKTIASGGRQ